MARDILGATLNETPRNSTNAPPKTAERAIVDRNESIKKPLPQIHS